MAYIRILFLLLILGAGVLFLVKKLHFSQHLAPFVVIVGNTILLYAFSLIGILKTGWMVCVGLDLLLGIFAFIPWPKQKSAEKQSLSPALVAGIIIFFAIAIYTYSNLFYSWDEFSYWGPIYKYLMVTNHLPDIASNFINTTYPPFTALFQYFVGNIIGNKESSAYFAQMLMAYSAILAVLPVKKWADWKKYTLALVVCILSVFLFDFNYQTLYVDLLLALFFAAGLSAAVFNENLAADRVVTVILASLASTLTKPLGIIFGLVCFVLIYVDYLCKNYELNSFKKFIRSIFKPILKPQLFLIVLLPVIATLSWSMHTAQFKNTVVNFSLKGTPINSADIFPWYPHDYGMSIELQSAEQSKQLYLMDQPNVINFSVSDFFRNFTINAPYRTKVTIQYFIKKYAVDSEFRLNFTPFEAVVVLFIISFIAFELIKKEQRKNSSLNRNNLLLLLGLLLYSFLLLAAYLYYFGASAGTSTPSLERYLSSYILAWLLLLFSYIYQQDSIEIPALGFSASIALNSLFLLIMLFTIPVNTYAHLPISPDGQRFQVNQVYKEVSNIITDKDKVYDVWQANSNKGLKYVILKYFLIPTASNNYGWQIGYDLTPEEETSFTSFYPDEWLKFLNDYHYTYVLVAASEPVFWQKYGMLFDKHVETLTIDKTIVPQLYSVTPKGLINVPLESATN